jgi:peptidoglycan-associated lipoprotein
LNWRKLMVRYSIAILVAALAGGLVLGCGSDPSPPPETPAGADDEPSAGAGPAAAGPAAARGDTATPTSGSIHIDPKIQQACGTLPTPHFAFDSAGIRETAKDNLEALAQCFTTGPLKGRELRLIGHADPRGEVDYNLALGQRRAGAVAEFLTQRGVAKAHLETLSKGEFEAHGVDEEGWARDRKVVIALVE